MATSTFTKLITTTYSLFLYKKIKKVKVNRVKKKETMCMALSFQKVNCSTFR